MEKYSKSNNHFQEMLKNSDKIEMMLALSAEEEDIGNTSANLREIEALTTEIEVIEEIEEDSDLEAVADSMTGETAIVTEEIADLTLTEDLEVHLQDSMTEETDLEVHQHTTLAPEGADQDPETALDAMIEVALIQDSVSLESSLEAETSAAGT